MAGIDSAAGAAYSYPYGYDDPEPSQTGTPLVNWIGAACSLALVVGLGVWGYQLIQRDVSGVPVIKAIADPMRERPVDPGGTLMRFQGNAVNEVQAGQASQNAPAQVVLAPQPLDLSATGGVQTSPLPLPSQAQNGSALGPETAPQMTDAERSAALEALADQIAGSAAPLSGQPSQMGQTAPTLPLADAQAADQIIPRSVPGVSTSPRPAARPSDLRIARATPASPTNPLQAPTLRDVEPQAVSAPSSLFVDPATIPEGTRMVQFGAFDSSEIAAGEWIRLTGRFGEFLSGKQPVIQEAVSGGRTFHRLRVMGFSDVSDARRFCSVFLSASTACIPVVSK